jgi:hypothetical protein
MVWLTWKSDVQHYIEPQPPSENTQVHIYLKCGEPILCGCFLKKYLICIKGLYILFEDWWLKRRIEFEVGFQPWIYFKEKFWICGYHFWYLHMYWCKIGSEFKAEFKAVRCELKNFGISISLVRTETDDSVATAFITWHFLNSWIVCVFVYCIVFIQI